MDASIIDLCDSDDDNNNNNKASASKVNNNNSIDDDDSSSSSSSDDSHLWNAGGFLKGSPASKKGGEIKAKRRGNYFKEVRGKYDGGNEVKRRKKGSPTVVDIEGAGSADDENGGSSKPDIAANKFSPSNVNNDKKGKKKQQFSSGSSSSNNTGKKQCNAKSKNDEEVDCIEIDLSDSSSTDGMNGNKKNVYRFPTFQAEQQKRPVAEKKGQNPYIENIPTTKKKSFESDDNSSHSSSTIPLPEDKLSPGTKKRSMKPAYRQKDDRTEGGKTKNGKGRVSFNNSDDVFFTNNDNGADFDVSFGGFDEDDDDQQHTTKANTGKKEPKSKSAPKMSVKDGVEVFDIDDSDDSSTSSAELYTPRPFKKKVKKPPPDAKYKSEEQSTTQSVEKKHRNSSSSTSKLLTPRAFSPATTSPTMGSYATMRKVPTPAIPAMSASLVKEIGGKLYPDLRHNFLIALTSHARRLRHNAYERASFDSALRSVIVISLHMRPLRSAEAARRMKGVGGTFGDLLKESVTGQKGTKPFAPANGKFSCVAPAALVGLLELEEANESVASANGRSFPMEDVIRKINQLLDPRANAALNQSAEKYLDKDCLDPGWGQMKKLCSTNAAADLGGPFIKERKKKDACASGRVYELLDSGRDFARKLKLLASHGPAEPGPLRQLPDDTVDESFGNVTMSMDFREGGGGGKSLHKYCDTLDVRGVPYVVRELKIADYIFFVGDKLAPILIERKTAEDVASSLHDGRWERQQRSMRKAQYVLGGGPARRCQICYIIEGDAAKRKVHGGNVGRRTWFQSLEDVESAIEQLPSLGFSVMKSKGHVDTVGILAKVAMDVSWKAKNGSIDANYTYKQFLSRVKVLGDEIGDPPTSQAHMNPAPPVVTNEEHIPEPSSNTAADDDGDPFSPQSDARDNNAKSKTSNDAQIEENSEEYAELKKLSIAQLKERCKERDEKIGGKKDDLIARLMKPRKPELLIMRVRRKEYVPKVPSCNAALMVALLLHHVPGTQGMTKERLMVLAEETGVSKESMSGDGGFYDGWSGMKQLQDGDPALVRREKGHRYSLTTQPPESSGRAIAHALHIVAHREGLCTCGNPPMD